jgi:hypothetical protein
VKEEQCGGNFARTFDIIISTRTTSDPLSVEEVLSAVNVASEFAGAKSGQERDRMQSRSI